MNKLVTTALVLLASAYSCATMANDQLEGNQYWQLGIGVSNVDFKGPLNNDIDNEWFTYIEAGIGYEFSLAQHWRLASDISVVYGDNDINFAHNASMLPEQLIDQNLEQVGIWANSRLHYDGFSNKLSPFVELGVGRMHTTFDDEHHNISQWDTVTRAAVGLQYRFTEDFSFALSVGNSDLGDLPVYH